MKLLSAILLLLLTGISSITHAAEDDKTIKSSRDFSLRCRSLNAENAQRSENVQEKSISVTVYSEYNSKDQTIEIGFEDLDTSEESFTLKYPLNFEVFQQKFDSLLSKDKKEELLASYGSHLDVFYWIVTITEDHNLPLAGVLTTSQYVMLSSSSETHKSDRERAEIVKKEIDSLKLAQFKLKNATDQKKDLEKKIKEFESFNDTITAVIFKHKGDTLEALKTLTQHPIVKDYLDALEKVKKIPHFSIIEKLFASQKPPKGASKKKQKEFEQFKKSILDALSKHKDDTLKVLKTLTKYPIIGNYVKEVENAEEAEKVSQQKVIQQLIESRKPDQKKIAEKKQKEFEKFKKSVQNIISKYPDDPIVAFTEAKKDPIIKNYLYSIEKDGGKKILLLSDIQKLTESKKPDATSDIDLRITQANSTLKAQLKEIEDLGIRKVSHVQYQFEKGYLERIQVYIESPETDNKEIFENSFPVGFSSISNYGNFTSTRLYRRNNKFNDDSKNNYIFLSDIIKLYENQLNLSTRDYSPGDTTVTVDPGSNPITQLSKQRNFYIIDGKTFTDVTGLSEDSPNGLVQIELSRRFNLWTHRIQVHGPNNYGFVNYVNAKVNFSKIENKLKGLPLRNQLIVENNAIVSPSYATNLDYLRYENLGVTLDLNLFLFDAPDFKYTFFLDAGIHYGHTPIIDSNYQITQGVAETNKTINKLDAHNFTFFPRAKLQLFAERRYGISLSYQANYTWLFTNNRFKQVLSYSGKGQDLNTLSTNKASHWSHMIEAAFYIDINPRSSTGKIFTTARFFFQQGDVNTFYPQILLGYAFNIFK